MPPPDIIVPIFIRNVTNCENEYENAMASVEKPQMQGFGTQWSLWCTQAWNICLAIMNQAAFPASELHQLSRHPSDVTEWWFMGLLANGVFSQCLAVGCHLLNSIRCVVLFLISLLRPNTWVCHWAVTWSGPSIYRRSLVRAAELLGCYIATCLASPLNCDRRPICHLSSEISSRLHNRYLGPFTWKSILIAQKQLKGKQPPSPPRTSAGHLMFPACWRTLVGSR